MEQPALIIGLLSPRWSLESITINHHILMEMPSGGSGGNTKSISRSCSGLRECHP
jgi:hypothetical protein